MHPFRFIPIRLALLALGSPAFAQLAEEDMARLESRLPPPASIPIRFEEHIQPIFEASNCYRCHGPERPRGGLRLDTRESALKGGNSGAAIVPGESARSPLVYYVARLVEDMEMPPEDRGDPLTPDQIAAVRAWIDQGAEWGAPPEPPPRRIFSVTPSLRWVAVDGDERLFSEHTGMKEGFNGPLQEVYWQENLGEGKRLIFDGRFFLNPEEYDLQLRLEDPAWGFARFGAEQYREYYDDSGGYYGAFTPPLFSLGRDLHLDVGRAWAELGLERPDGPRVTLAYEYRYRDGTKSTLAWGDVGTISPELNPPGTDAKKIYPASKQIDEQAHIFTLTAAHEVRGLGIENEFRGELYDNETRREQMIFYNLASGSAEKLVDVREGQDHWQISDSFRLEKQVVDWLFLSGGYNYSRLEGQYALSTEPIYPDGLVRVPAEYWFTDSIILEQDSHVVNANAKLGPWAGFTLFGGTQSEWMRQRGMGTANLDFGDPVNGVMAFPATMDSDLERASVEEHLGARFTKIPFTVVFAEGRLAQESISHWEEHTGGFYPFLRDTRASSELGEARVGFALSPWTRVSLTAHYKYRDKTSHYDHLLDQAFGFPNPGYSAFITSREIESDELSAKLSWRAASWLQTGLAYQRVSADYTTATPEAPFASPGGSLLAGTSDFEIYSASLRVSPWRRLHLANTFSFRHTRTATSHTVGDLIAPYEGDLYSSISSATYALNDRTDLTAGYTYSWADYGQRNTAGLPLGIIYDWHIASAGLARRFNDDLSAALQYRFYHYNEEGSGGFNDYQAHAVIASMTMVLR